MTPIQRPMTARTCHVSPGLASGTIAASTTVNTNEAHR